MTRVNRKLLPLKGLLFSYFCGFGCVWPFFSVHMKQLGLSIQETAIINLVLPFLSAICAPILGGIVDRFGHYRRFLLCACIFMAILYSTLIFVPSVTEESPFIPDMEAFFLCSANRSIVAVTKDGRGCQMSSPNGKIDAQVMISTNNYNVMCLPNSSHFQPDKSFCLRNDSSLCSSSIHNDTKSILLSLSVIVKTSTSPLIYNSHFHENNYCFYSLRYISYRNQTFSYLTCPSLPNDCFRSCLLIDTGKTFVRPKEKKVYRHSMLTFWLYIITRAMADVLFIISYPLTDAISISLLRQHGGSFGRQMLFGILALGIAGPIVGYLNDIYTDFTGRNDYLPCFMAFDVFMLVTIIFVYNLPFRMGPQPKGVYRAILRLLKDVEVLALYVAVIVLGTNYGFLETFLYWFLQDLGASRFLIGITWTVGVFPSLPFLYKSKVILEKVGHANLLAFAFFVYAIRYLGYSFINNPWYCLPFESIEVFTFFLTRATFCTYSALLSPPSLMVTSQAMMASLHLMIGRGFGSLIGGYLMASYGPRRVFRGASAFCCICGTIYFLLYQLHIKAKRAKKKMVPNALTSDKEGSSLVSDRDERAIPMEEMSGKTVMETNANRDHVTLPFLTGNGSEQLEILQEELEASDRNHSLGKKDGECAIDFSPVDPQSITSMDAINDDESKEA